MAVKGTFKDIPFVELLMLMEQTQKTGRLEVTIDRRWAMVIFQDGQVWHVEPRGFRGASPEEVVFEMMSAVDGNFVFQRLHVLPSLERTVHVSTEALILEGTKRLDDAAAAADSLTDTKQLEQVPRFLPGAEAKVRYVPQKTKQVLMAIDGKRTLKQVVQFSQMDPVDVSAVINEMMEKNVIEMVEVEMVPEGKEGHVHAASPVAAPPLPPVAAPPVMAPPIAEALPVADAPPQLTITPAAPVAPPSLPAAPPIVPPAAPPVAAAPALHIKAGAEANLRFMPQKVKRLLGAIDGQRDVEAVIAACDIDHEEAIKIINDLTSQGVLEVS